MRILFVEDDLMIGEAVFASLKDASYAVDWVRDGEMALSSITVCPYDVVLLDLPAQDRWPGCAEKNQSRKKQCTHSYPHGP